MTIPQIEAESPTLVRAKLHRKVRVQTRITLGDRQRNCSTGVLAFVVCPVITLSPIVLAECARISRRPSCKARESIGAAYENS